jgi:hypothetical protein
MTLFNQSAPINTKFWRPIGYIPNLSYGKGTADKTSMRDEIQNEHTTHVIHVLFNHFVEYLRVEDLTLLFLVRKCILMYVFITSLEIPRAITNGWASILVKERESNNQLRL